MALENHYPSVVLLDNENNPISPLVDIVSIYSDIKTKEDAGVLVAPVEYKDIDDYIMVDDSGELSDDNGQPLYLIVGAEVKDRKIVLKRVKASLLLGQFVDDRIWEGLQDKDEVPIVDKDENELQVKKPANS